MMVRTKVFFVLCLSTIFSTDSYIPLSERSVKDSPIFGLLPIDKYLYKLPDNLEIPKSLQHKLGEGTKYHSIRATFSSDEVDKISSFMMNLFANLNSSPEYSRVPKLLISLQLELQQLDAFLFEADQLKDSEKADKYISIKSTLDQIISKVNEAIKEAIKETVYSSDDIEAVYAKLVQLGDVLDLESNELSREINFDSQRLEADGRKELYSTLIELRNALARDEEFMNIIVHLRSRLGTVYRVSFPDYERVRTEAYYVLKLARQKMRWNRLDLDEAIMNTKKLLEEMYQIPVRDWKDLFPEIPGTHIKGIRFQIDDYYDPELNSRLTRNEPRCPIELPYKEGRMCTYNLEESLKVQWITLCEIFETVYENEPTKEGEELYRLLCALGDFNLINESRQFLFFPWFDPMVYTRKLRRLHTGLHFFKSAVYSPIGRSFGLDIIHSISEQLEASKKKEPPEMSILNQAILKTFIVNLITDGALGFFNYSDTNYLSEGLQSTVRIDLCYYKTLLSALREIQCRVFNIEKVIMKVPEFTILKRMEDNEIALMLDVLDYRYSIVQLSLLSDLSESESTSAGSNASTISTASSGSSSTNIGALDSNA